MLHDINQMENVDDDFSLVKNKWTMLSQQLNRKRRKKKSTQPPSMANETKDEKRKKKWR